ncbi:MAG: hypothetical protein JGK17_14000 [Microcoleus sp. PH2017_10_PVI_O_A]|uniref:hypothetical protein n=1 Tax=unclassified Microcoleus TaxID=2642155 RepID=UPI001DA824F3|nr:MULTISPECIES: hypothetical protein [unclassified Microcoleus]MCC3540202.1 hypothetical protein [Microcoleus sp. PH2017_22_RUC_O_B]TAE81962.1 MAG: hypothetical protein EAZ83_13640 [Oscillatoriales cyanobacterium]MCC3406677.1 hypothetical protein [Microcoleus sp. PH2017_10_PVI_O_A]MCC3460673.1 hypothetical protein [Microcoleus sp. PH2017_11_PCY_U_A]MCC3479236.1 hypothetical protein [Microcoleus sp. PH2017_12_PCY_D_A]
MAKPKSAQDSNSQEKTFQPNWNPFCQKKSGWLSLPAKLVGAGWDSILSHVRTRPQKLRYCFSNRATLAHNEKSLKMSSPSSTSLVAAWVSDSENTNSKYAKTVSYQVYPCHKLGVIRKKWVSAVRKVYNISIAYLDEHQGFSRISNSGEKPGLKMVLKTSGLIPKWCIPRTLAAFKTRIHDLGWECDKQIASAFATTYDFIFFPTFEMYKRVIQKNRILRSKTATSMMNLAGKNPGKPYKTCVALTVPS